MRNRRTFLGGLAAGWAILLGFAVGGCGTSSGSAPSSLDPAMMAPAGSALYLSLTVRPQGGQRSAGEQVLHKLFGLNADAMVRRQVEKLMHGAHVSYTQGVQPWLGQRIAVVVTELAGAAPRGVSQAAVALIAPTSNPAAARSFVESQLKRHPTAGETGGVIGHYVVYGGSLAYQRILGVAKTGSLASSPGYRQTVGQLGGSPAATYYVNLGAVTRAIASASASSSAGANPLAGAVRQALSRLGRNAAVGGGVTLSPHAVSFDAVNSGVHQPARIQRVPANVGRLPASAWLAIDTGGSALSPAAVDRMASGFRLGIQNALRLQGLAGNALAGVVAGRLAFVERDLLPALGPFSLAIGGSSPLSLTAGFSMKPARAASARAVLAMLEGLAAHSASLNVSGTPTSFAVRVPTGGSLTVNDQAGRVVATYGYSNQHAFLAPAATLASTPAYRQALAQLPSGSSVPLFLSFGPIAGLEQLLNHGASAAKTSRLLNELTYLIAGGRSGHERLVLGLK